MRYKLTAKHRLGRARYIVYLAPTGKYHLRKHGTRDTYKLTEAQAKRAAKKYRKIGWRITSELIDKNPFHILEAKYSLVRSSTDHDAPGVHAQGSFHYQVASWGGVQAYDYGISRNGTDRLITVANDIRRGKDPGEVVPKYQGRRVRECFGPFGYYIKDGVVHSGMFPGHKDHLHLALG